MAAERKTWITPLAVMVCIGIYLGLALRNDYESWDTLAKFGYLPAEQIWDGGYWALVTSVFVHFALWHLGFNAYWLWVLGSRLERAIGSLPFLGFFVAAAFVSSSLQLAVSGSTGIGASGVVYAIFGFMWVARTRHISFSEVLDARTIRMFTIWLVGCIVATYLKIWEVGNAAHVSGLLFGAVVAGAWVPGSKRMLMLAGTAVLLAASILPLVWCPWSATWLGHQAYADHAAGRYEAAIARYTRILGMKGDNHAWAFQNRGLAYEALGQQENARADLQRAREIDPAIQGTEQE